MGPQMYNPSPNMMGQPNNGYGSPQTANYYNPYYANPNYNQQVPSQPRPNNSTPVNKEGESNV